MIVAPVKFFEITKPVWLLSICLGVASASLVVYCNYAGASWSYRAELFLGSLGFVTAVSSLLLSGLLWLARKVLK